MPEIIKVKANEAGNYPITLFGTEYEIQPVKTKRATTEAKNEGKKPTPDTSPDAVGQPVNDTPEQEAK